MLVDTFGRIHDYLRISLTDKCNLRCTYCMPAEGLKDALQGAQRMTAQEISAIAGVFVRLGVRKIRLTGGEPLVRKDAREIIELLSYFPVQLTLTTNGVYVDDFVDTFRSAGIRSVNVSLDALTPATFRSLTLRDHFDKVKSNIFLLLEKGFHVKVNMVVMKGMNHLEVVDFVQWTKEFPLHVRFIEYMPFRENGWNRDALFSSAEILQLLSREFEVERLRDRPNDTARNYRAAGHQGTFAVISTMTDPFCDTCNRLRLTADGKMKNCLFSAGEVDILSVFRQGEDIEAYILQCVKDKKAARGGQMEGPIDELKADEINNRSMVAIGG